VRALLFTINLLFACVCCSPFAYSQALAPASKPDRLHVDVDLLNATTRSGSWKPHTKEGKAVSNELSGDIAILEFDSTRTLKWSIDVHCQISEGNGGVQIGFEYRRHIYVLDIRPSRSDAQVRLYNDNKQQVHTDFIASENARAFMKTFALDDAFKMRIRSEDGMVVLTSKGHRLSQWTMPNAIEHKQTSLGSKASFFGATDSSTKIILYSLSLSLFPNEQEHSILSEENAKKRAQEVKDEGDRLAKEAERIAKEKAEKDLDAQKAREASRVWFSPSLDELEHFGERFIGDDKAVRISGITFSDINDTWLNFVPGVTVMTNGVMSTVRADWREKLIGFSVSEKKGSGYFMNFVALKPAFGDLLLSLSRGDAITVEGSVFKFENKSGHGVFVTKISRN
jgi:hypothetical protein